MRRAVALLLAVVVTSGVLAGCSSTVTVVPPMGRAADLSAYVDAFVASSRSGRYEQVADVLVVAGDRVVVERHRRGPPEVRRDVGEMTGAVLATLVGIALQDGLIRSVDQTVAELVPDTAAGPVTLHQVLTSHAVPGESGVAAVDVLAAVLAAATGRPVPEYAREMLFGSLGIDPPWTPGGRLRLTAAEMAALGTLWLRRGHVGDRQIVPAAWVDASMHPYVATGRRRLPWFGYGLWRTQADGLSAVAVTGRGGQLIEMVPDLDLLVVVTCDDGPHRLGVPNAPSEAFVELVSGIVVPHLRRRL